MVESFHLSYELPCVTARPFNTFGPRQTARAVIPTIASQLLMKSPIIKLGSLTPSRDFNYVKNTVDGLIALGACEKALGQTVNIGSGDEWTIEETFQKLCRITGWFPEVITDEQRVRPKASEVNRLIADNNKITQLTGWKARVSFDDGLERTVEWIADNLHRFNGTIYAK